MKKSFYAVILAVASLVIGCNPEPEETPTYDGSEMNYCEVTNLGDFGNNGNTQFLVQMATLNDEGSFTTLMSAHFETNAVSGNEIPEGTYTLQEGDYVDFSYFAGSFFMTASSTAIDYLLITDGTIKVEKTAEGYCFSVEANGIDQASGDLGDPVKCRWQGATEVKSNRYNPDWAIAAFMGSNPQTEVLPYWNLQLDDHYIYFLNLFVNTSIDSFEGGLPEGDYVISDSMAANTVDMSYNVGGNWWGSVAWKVLEDDSKEAHNLMIGGNVKITKTGEIKTKNYTDGTSDIVCDYKIEVLFYNQTYVPHVAVYEGELILFDDSAEPDYNLELSLNYYGNNKWCVIYSDEKDDFHALLYCYSAEDTTWEGGLSTGKYTVDEEVGIPWENIPMGPEFTIKPGWGEGSVYKGTGSVIYPYDWNGIADIITYGTMDVVNNGDNNYDIKIDVGSAFGYYVVNREYSGSATLHNAAKAAEKAPALEVLKAKTTSKKGYKKDTSFEFRGPVLGR